MVVGTNILDSLQSAQRRKMLQKCMRLSARTVGERCGVVIRDMPANLLDELSMRRIAAKFVTRLLTDDQKQHRLEVSMELKEQVINDSRFLSQVVTGGDSWICGYEPETKQQSSQWKCPSLARQVKSSVRPVLIYFFDTDVLTHEEFFPPGQTVNTKFDILRRLLEGMRRKQADQLVREQLL